MSLEIHTNFVFHIISALMFYLFLKKSIYIIFVSLQFIIIFIFILVIKIKIKEIKNNDIFNQYSYKFNY